MVRYLSLVNFTPDGARNIKDTVKRAKAFQSLVEQAGGTVVGLYWAMGDADGAAIFEAPSEEAATTVLLKLAQQGNVRTRSLRIYNQEEMAKILKGL
jgi:uncharacterized protein with GYD domain